MEICKYLSQEGVCYVKKDFNLAKHLEIDVPILQVIKLMQSFKSKEFPHQLRIEHLRTYLNLPSEIVPATLKKQAKPFRRPFGGHRGVHLALRESTNLVTVMDTVEETRVVLLLSADYRPSFG
ncbi:hypothetical protein HN873_015580, partial [Arachis hypogaea]